jgi:hypothetical protein
MMETFLKNIRQSLIFTALLALTAVFFLSSCGKPASSQSLPVKPLTLLEELEALDTGKYIGSVPYSSSSALQSDPEWTIYKFNRSVCKCIYGDEFQIGYKKKTETDNIIFFMSGGGACWEGNAACMKSAKLPSGWKQSPGFPYNGWSVIHMPYCDGSVHMGDNIINYDGKVHNHMGLKLTTAGVSLMKKINPNPPKILITGSSAGGYGTFVAYLLIRRFFPDSAIYIFNDAGPGLWNQENGMKEKISTAWKYLSFFPKSCANCNEHLIYLYDWILQRDTNIKIGLFSSYNDSTVGNYYLKLNTKETPFGYKNLLMSTTGEIQAKHPGRFKRFFIDSDIHCVVNAPGKYSYKIQGISVAGWIRNMLNDDPAWKDLLE